MNVRNRKNNRMQKTVLTILVVLLSIGLILPSLAQIVYVLIGS